MAKFFGTNGIRGVFPDDFSLEFIHDMTLSIGTYFEKGPILIGYDGRESSPLICKVSTSTLNSVGINFQKYDKISAWRIISINRMTLETKSSVLYEGVSRSTKMIEAIGIYTYKLKCKKTEQLL